MTEPSNADRANWARSAVERYANLTNAGAEALDDPESAEEVISDLLCDLQHLADELRISTIDQLRLRGAIHYAAEVAGNRDL